MKSFFKIENSKAKTQQIIEINFYLEICATIGIKF